MSQPTTSQDASASTGEKGALLKLDIEGAEIVALQGLRRHRKDVENAVLECARSHLKKHSTLEQVKTEFRQLEEDGFQACKLWSPRISRRNSGMTMNF